MNRHRKRIAILGATSHIAKSLIVRFFRRGGHELHLYARSPEQAELFLRTEIPDTGNHCRVSGDFTQLRAHAYDAVINCIGVGTRQKLRGDFTRYFTVTEKFDNMVLGYLSGHNPDALYISFSSGAVYGKSFSAPAREDSLNCIGVNQVTSEDFYSIARLNSEAKHRAFKDLNIVDIRIFSYFSRYIDLADGYFITEVINSILNKTILETSGTNFVRDYLHPDDLFSMVLACLDAGKTNAAFDVISAQPVKKQQILDYFSSTYGLVYVVKNLAPDDSPTGSKHLYFSENPNAEAVGYQARFTSMEALADGAAQILHGREISRQG